MNASDLPAGQGPAEGRQVLPAERLNRCGSKQSTCPFFSWANGHWQRLSFLTQTAIGKMRKGKGKLLMDNPWGRTSTDFLAPMAIDIVVTATEASQMGIVAVLNYVRVEDDEPTGRFASLQAFQLYNEL